MIVFVDTSALFALLDEDDANHAAAATAFESLAGRAELVTTNYVVVEALALVNRRLGAAHAIRLVDAILPVVKTVWIDQPLHGEAVAAWRADPRRASLVDHASFAVMRAQRVPVAFAFDADFEKQGFQRPTVDGTHSEHRVHEHAAGYRARGAPAQPLNDLVGVAEIASRSGRSINTVQSWRRRNRDFPEPSARLAASPVWSWPAVADWINARGAR